MYKNKLCELTPNRLAETNQIIEIPVLYPHYTPIFNLSESGSDALRQSAGQENLSLDQRVTL